MRTAERLVSSAVTDLYVHRRREAVYRWFAAKCLKEGHRVVLDAGCREGYGASILAAAGLEVLAVDADVSLIERARRIYRFGRISFEPDEPDDINRDDAAFDAVISAGLVERLVDAGAFVDEAKRLLRTGGPLVVATTNRLTASPGRTRPMNGEHAWEFTPDELQRVCGTRFTDMHLLGVFHGRRLRLVERALGGPLQLTSVRLAPADRTFWLRAALRGIRASDFLVRPGTVREAIDLVAVAVR